MLRKFVPVSRNLLAAQAAVRSLSTNVPSGHEIFHLGPETLQSGMTLRNPFLIFKTFGRLNKDKSNAIVYPCWFTGKTSDNEWLIGEGMGLDPSKYFIIIPSMLGNGYSTSPSNTPPPFDRARFPNITVYDNVRLQHRLVTEHFGISKLRLVTGWSMGAGQTYQWAVSYPEMVENILPFCGSARTSEHNKVFLEGVKAALVADGHWNHGWYDSNPSKGMRSVARVYAGWGFSQEFYRQHLYKELGYSSLEDFLVGFWEGFFLNNRDANNLLCQLWTWQNGNIGNTPGFNGNFESALKAIKARAIVMPASTDLYFPPEDNEYEVRHMPNAELRVIKSAWGHFAGAGLFKRDTLFIDQAIKDLLK